MERLRRPPEVNVTLGDYIASGFNTWLRNILGVQTAHGTKIATLEAQIAQGAAFTDKFNRPDSTLLGNGWTQFGAGQQLGIIDYAARLNNLGIAAGIRGAIAPVVMTDNNHSATAVVNPKGVARNVATGLYIQANNTMTEFVYALCFGKAIFLGRGTRSGDVWTYNDWASNTGVTINESDVVDLKAEGTKYTVLLNNIPVITHTDVSSYPRDDSHRYVGFSSETQWVTILWQYSWGLAAFTARNIEYANISAVEGIASGAAALSAEAQQTAADVAAALEEYKTQLEEGQSDSVISESLNFSSYPDSTGIPRFVLSHNSPVVLGVQGGNAKFIAAGPEMTTYGLYSTASSMNDHYAKIVISSTVYAGTRHGVIVRAKADFTEFVFANCSADGVWLGRAYWNGSGYSEDPLWGSYSKGPGNGATLELRAQGDTYTVLVNSVPRISVNKTAAQYPQDASHRHTGVYLRRNQIFGINYIPSFKLFAMADAPPPSYTGVGWRVAKTTLTQQTVSSGTQLPLVFNFTDPSTKNCTVEDQTGRVRILVSGRYALSASLSWLTQASSSGPQDARVDFWVERAGALGTFVPIARGAESVRTQTSSIAELITTNGSAIVWLDEGDSIHPRLEYHAISGSRPIDGDSEGSLNFFSGALITSIRGPKGDPGIQGDQGLPGPGAKFDYVVANAAALPAGVPELSQALTNDTGTIYLYRGGVWLEGPLVRGPQGIQGVAGPANSLAVGTVSTGAPGSAVSFSITGASPMQMVNVTIPRGDTGAPGPVQPQQQVTTLPGSGTIGTLYWIAE